MAILMNSEFENRFLALKEIIEGDLGKHAASSFSKDAVMLLIISKGIADSPSEILKFTRKKGLNLLEKVPHAGPLLNAQDTIDSLKPDISINCTIKAIDAVIALEGKTISSLGICLYKLLNSQELDKKVEVRIHIGIIKFFLKGYPSILAKGGSELTKFLISVGLSSPSAIKKALTNIINKG